MNKIHLVGTSVAEMPRDGRRFRFHVERYRSDDGEEWGQITSMEEIPDVGTYLWIPSYGTENADETEHLRLEYEYEKANPKPQEQEWNAQRVASRATKMDWYNDLRDARAELIRRSPRTLRAR